MQKKMSKILLMLCVNCMILASFCVAQVSLEIEPTGCKFEMQPTSPQVNIDLAIRNTGSDPVSLLLSVESPDSTYILYCDEPDTNNLNGNIWKMRPDGSDKTQITSDTLDFEAVWSPDGTEIVFYSLRSGNNDVWTMDADGSNMSNLTNAPASDMYPSWSPDGQSIIFVSDRDDARLEVYKMDADGSNVTRLTYNSFLDLNPSYSPDGQHFVTQSKPAGSHYDICVYTSDGTSFVNVGAPGVYCDYQPSWTPFGERVVWASGDPSVGGLDIVSNNIDGTDFQTDLSLPENLYIPKYSPDGQFWAFDIATDTPVGGDDINIWHTELDTVYQIADYRKWGPDWSPFLNSPTWLSLSQNTLQLNAGDSSQVTVAIDLSGFAVGLYTASVMLEDASNILLTTVPINVFFGIPMSEDDNPEVIQYSSLEPTYPNPFIYSTSINYSLKESGLVVLSIYNLKGQFVKNIVNTQKERGEHSAFWDGRDENGLSVKNGIYLYTLHTGDGRIVAKRMVVLR